MKEQQQQAAYTQDTQQQADELISNNSIREQNLQARTHLCSQTKNQQQQEVTRTLVYSNRQTQ
jgi:hypothetical protein